MVQLSTCFYTRIGVVQIQTSLTLDIIGIIAPCTAAT